MTRTTTTNQIDQETAANLIRRRAKMAAEGFEDIKAKFAAEFETNPKYALEWHADKVAQAQTRYEWWYNVAKVLDASGIEAAVAYAAERIQIEIDAFFGSNSTCPWTNALRRIEAEVYNSVARYEMRDLRNAAKDAN